MVVRSEASWKASRSPLATIDAAAARLLGSRPRRRGNRRPRSRHPWRWEAAGRDQLGQAVELLDDVALEDAAALVGREELLPPVRHRQRIPGGQHRARLLGLKEADQVIGEADDRAAALAVGAAHRLRHGVIGAVREGIAVDDEKRRRRPSVRACIPLRRRHGRCGRRFRPASARADDAAAFTRVSLQSFVSPDT